MQLQHSGLISTLAHYNNGYVRAVVAQSARETVRSQITRVGLLDAWSAIFDISAYNSSFELLE